MKNVKMKVMLLLLLCLILTSNISVMAQYATGVKPGDWIKYDVSITSGTLSAKGTIKISIQSVSGTTISGMIEVTGVGMPIPSQTFTLDVSYGGGTAGSLIIPANLQPGQSIPGLGTTVQSVMSKFGRQTVYATSSVMGISGQYYWDQATGVLLEASAQATGASYSVKATETNMFSLGGFDWLLIVIIVVIVVVVVTVVVVIWRKRKPPVTPLPQQVQPPPPPPPSES